MGVVYYKYQNIVQPAGAKICVHRLLYERYTTSDVLSLPVYSVVVLYSAWQLCYFFCVCCSW